MSNNCPSSNFAVLPHRFRILAFCRSILFFAVRFALQHRISVCRNNHIYPFSFAIPSVLRQISINLLSSSPIDRLPPLCSTTAAAFAASSIYRTPHRCPIPHQPLCCSNSARCHPSFCHYNNNQPTHYCSVIAVAPDVSMSFWSPYWLSVSPTALDAPATLLQTYQCSVYRV